MKMATINKLFFRWLRVNLGCKFKTKNEANTQLQDNGEILQGGKKDNIAWVSS